MTDVGGASEGTTGTFSLDGYEHLTEIGRGGSGVVYRAWQSSFERWVAIKVVRIAADHASLSQFERERTAIGALSGHPNIVTVYDAGLTSTRLGFIVMEYLPDGTLADRLRDGPLPWPEAAVIGVKLSGALESAHRVGVLHLDVKPENVFLARDFDAVKLGDFGIAHIRGRAATRTGMITGTLLHIAPERLRDPAATVANDVYSLGSTLFALLEGRPRFGRPDEPDYVVMARIVDDRPAVPELGVPDLPPLFGQIVERAMARDPKERHASAVEVGEQLRAVQAEAGLDVTPMLVATASRSLPPPVGPADDKRDGGEDTLPPTPTPVKERKQARVRGRKLALVGTAMVVTTALVILAVVEVRSKPPAGPDRSQGSTTLAQVPADQREVAFSDDFSNPSTGWPRSADADYDNEGGYRIRIKTDHNRLAAGPRMSEPALQELASPGVNVSVEVDAQPGPTLGGMGLFCRYQAGNRDRYRAVVFANGLWNITRDSKGTRPQVSGEATLPQDGGTYRIRLECSGSGKPTTVALSVGGKPIGAWTDPDGLVGGALGIQAATATASSAEVRFDNFVARKF